MYSDDDILYALETTEVIHEPDRRIDTFGSTSFSFHLLSELMDNVNQVRVRSGSIEAERPRIVKPEAYAELFFDGFGEQADAFADWLKRNGANLSMLKYGFNFRKGEVQEDVVHEPFETVLENVMGVSQVANNPLGAVIRGVDDTWEISLLKFTLEMIQKSQGINIFDFKRRGLL
ncbi:MAG: hypothetical protein ACC661_00585 [Verrucomicrobiales bacterium]